MDLYECQIKNLSATELARLLRLLHLADDKNDAELHAKVQAEYARVLEVEKMQAKARADRERYQANVAYVRNSMKPGDVIEFTSRNWSGTGKEFTRRMRVISFRINERRHVADVDIDGVVLTKSGLPHGSLNNHGYPDSGHRWEHGISLGHIRLIEAA